MLDNILDDFEEKKGIESTKPKKDSSFGSQNNQAFTKGGQASGRGGADPWGREVLDDLDDLGGNEDTKSKKSGGAATQSLLDKKKALFGLP